VGGAWLMHDWLTQPVATLGAGFVVGVAAIVTFVSAWLGRRQDRRHFASSQAIERLRDFRDRYTAAAGQLGDKSSPAIRLAGVYALVGLADEWLNYGSQRDSQMAIDLLRAYLRTKPPSADCDEQEHEVRKAILTETAARSGWWTQARDSRARSSPIHERGVAKADLRFALDGLRYQRKPKSVRGYVRRIRALMGVYGNFLIAVVKPGRSSPEQKGRGREFSAWQDMNTDLLGSYLVGMSFPGTQLMAAGVGLAGVPMVDADLSRTDLRSADLEIAQLSRAVLVDANLVDVYARGAILEFADLRGADLRWANLGDADLSGANLAGANLLDAKLDNATVCGANFTGAALDRKAIEEVEAGGGVFDDPDWVAHQHARYPHIRTYWPGGRSGNEGGAAIRRAD
jgi:Pentapeptide repeats (8 copies)